MHRSELQIDAKVTASGREFWLAPSVSRHLAIAVRGRPGKVGCTLKPAIGASGCRHLDDRNVTETASSRCGHDRQEPLADSTGRCNTLIAA